MLRGWPSAKHASVSRFNPLNLERILWLRKRRRRKRRRRRRRPRSPRSEFSPGWSAQLRPGIQFFSKLAGPKLAFFISSAFLILGDAPFRHCEERSDAAIHLGAQR